MNNQIERTRHISITRTGADGSVSQTEVHITEVSAAPDDADATVSGGDCFDPSSCCSAREQAMIAALRAYLRPDVAPECLMAKLKATLDHCCDGK
ncbi:hypothetical protein [Bifidobacterium callitrichidarum]|uniref:Uncharacterized protein n=1 Tax=Bifidobacterium callitrichidarum TaxID=2052941 RepID=A0A2U2MZ51_9BIFI|nr:hypothetical protein [Bifidobacterium callitrichidarum]PWG62271.1 hypothetical protein DF196_12460 [Bifidobacterium callitrichidarum]